MPCKSKEMRGKLLLEQDLTLTKLVDICQNLESVKIQAKEMDDGKEESVSSNRKPPKKSGKPNLVKVLHYLQSEKICVTVLQN